jgi:uncharacterized membrane protein
MEIRKHKRLIQNFLFWIGILFIISPILLYCFIHSNCERYLWVINQPFAINYFRSGPFQLWMDVILVLIGFILIILGIRLKWKNKK